MNKHYSPFILLLFFCFLTLPSYGQYCDEAPLCGDNRDCCCAVAVCDDSSFSGSNDGEGELDELLIDKDGMLLPPDIRACLSGGERNPSWYIIQLNNDTPENSELTFTVTMSDPTINNTYFFAVYGPDVACGDLGAPLKHTCKLGDTQPRGLRAGEEDDESDDDNDGFLSPLTVNPNETYLILLDNSGGDDSFDIEWGGSAVAAGGLNCFICELEVEVTTPPPATPVCYGDELTLEATVDNPHAADGESMRWVAIVNGAEDASFVFDPPNAPNTSVTPPAGFNESEVTYQLEVTTTVVGNDVETCIRTDEIVVPYEGLSLDPSLVVNPDELCLGDVPASNNFSYTGGIPLDATLTWDFGDGSPTQTGDAVSYNYADLSGSPYTVTLTITSTSSTCTDAVSFQVTVQDKLETPDVSGDVCGGFNDQIQLDWPDVPNITEYQIDYNEVSDATVTTVTTVDSEFNLTGLSEGDSYRFIITALNDAFCDSESATLICPVEPCPDPADNNYPNSDLQFDTDARTEFCLDFFSTNTYQFEASPSGGVFNTTANNGDVDSDGFFNPSTTGPYTVTYTIQDEFGCDYTPITLDVTVNEGRDDLPITIEDQVENVTITSDVVCSDKLLAFSTTGIANPQSVSWNFGDGTIDNDSPHIYDGTFNFSNPLTVTVTVTDENGCQNTGTRDINVLPEIDLRAYCGANATPTNVPFEWFAVTGATAYDLNIVITHPDLTTTVRDTTTTELIYNTWGVSPGDNIEITITPNVPFCNITNNIITCSSECPLPTNPPSSLGLEFPANTPASICEGATYQLEAVPTGGTYSFEGTSTNITVSATGLVTGVNGGNSSYTITYSYTDPATSCPYEITQSMMISNAPALQVDNLPITVCTNETHTFGLVSGTELGITAYQWDFGADANPSTSTAANPVVAWNMGGAKDFSVTVTNDDNCSTSQVITGQVTVSSPLANPDVTCVSTTTNEVVFGWDEITGAEQYTILVRILDENGSEINTYSETIFNTSTTTLTVDQLDPGNQVSITFVAEAPATNECGNSAAANQTCRATACPVVNPTISGVDDNICTNDATISLNNAGDPAGGAFTLTDPLGTTTPVTEINPLNLSAGTYTLVYEYTNDANGCTYDTDQEFTISDEPINSFEPNNIALHCISEQLTFVPSTPVPSTTYNWTFEDGNPATATTQGSQSVDVVFLSTGAKTVSLLATSTANCTNSTPFEVDIQVADTIQRATIVCADVTSNSITFAWNSPLTGITYDVLITDDTGSTLANLNNTTDNQITLNDLDSGTTADISVITNDPSNPCLTSAAATSSCSATACPEVTLNIPSAVCPTDDPFELAPLASIADGFFSFFPGGGADPVIIDSLKPADLAPGFYSIAYTYQNGECISNPVALQVLAPPVPDISNPTGSSYCLSEEVEFLYNGITYGGATYTWSFEDATPSTAMGNLPPLVTFNSAGSKRVSVTVMRDNGCSATREILVSIEAPPTASVDCTDQGQDYVTFTWSGTNGNGSFDVVVSVDGIQEENLLATTDTEITINNITSSNTVSIEVTALGDAPCTNSEVATTNCSPLACSGDEPMISNLPATYCTSDGVLDLSGLGTPAGGSFNLVNTAATNDTLKNLTSIDPAVVGLGTYNLIYTYSDGTCDYASEPATFQMGEGATLTVNCRDRSTDEVTFEWQLTGGTGLVDVEITVNGAVTETPSNLSTSEITVDNLNEGDDVGITVTAQTTVACQQAIIATTNCEALACDGTPATFSGLADNYCSEDDPVDLTGLGSPAGGTYMLIDLIALDTLKNITSFDPSSLTGMNYTVVYTYSDANCDYTSDPNDGFFQMSEALSVAISIEEDDIFCQTETVTINIIGTIYPTATYNWDFGTDATPPNASSTGSVSQDVSWTSAGEKDIRVEVIDPNGCTVDTTVTIEIIAQLEAPTVTCTDRTTSEVSFGWDNVAGATEYQVTTTIDGLPATSTTVSETTYTEPNLQEGQEVIITVVALGNPFCNPSGIAGSQNCEAINCAPSNPEITNLQADYCPTDDPFLLAGFATPPGGIFRIVNNSTSDSLVISEFNPAIYNPGSYTFLYTYSPEPGCEDEAIWPFTILQPANATISLSDVSFCAGDEVSFNIAGSGSITGTYSWTFENGMPADTMTTGSLPVQSIWTTPGEYDVSLSVSKPNECAADTTITVRILGELDIPNVVCAGVSENSVNFEWDAIQGASGYYISVFVNGGQTKSEETNLLTHEELGLAVGDTVRIEVVALNDDGPCFESVAGETFCVAQACPLVPINFQVPPSFCLEDANYPLVAEPAGGVFTIGNDAVTDINPINFGEGSFNITYTLDINGCEYREDTIINIISGLEADFSLPTEACAGDPITLQIANFNDLLNYAWDWGTTDQITPTINLDGSVELTYNSGGTKQITLVSDDGACTSEPIVHDIFIREIQVTAPPSVSIVEGNGEKVRVTAVSTYTNNFTYLWEPASADLSCTDCPDPLITPTTPGIYNVTVIDSLGCSETVAINIEIEDGLPDVLIPNAFSPNGDNHNDVFNIVTDGTIQSYEIHIYNRWGEKLFESTDPTQGWNGRNNEVMMPVGTYVYWVVVTLEEDQRERTLSGNVSLIR